MILRQQYLVKPVFFFPAHKIKEISPQFDVSNNLRLNFHKNCNKSNYKEIDSGGLLRSTFTSGDSRLKIA